MLPALPASLSAAAVSGVPASLEAPWLEQLYVWARGQFQKLVVQVHVCRQASRQDHTQQQQGPAAWVRHPQVWLLSAVPTAASCMLQESCFQGHRHSMTPA